MNFSLDPPPWLVRNVSDRLGVDDQEPPIDPPRAVDAQTISEEMTRVLAEHPRADHKAQVVAGFASLAATVLAGTASGGLALAAAFGWVSSAILAGAVLFPRLAGGFGFVAYARARTGAEVEGLVAGDASASPEALRSMARLARSKYRLVQAAYLSGGVALVLTALVLR